ncbi:hypothetical protein EYZ11_003546 [Aspergillus tanneri]|uniref:RCC1-like domain-containing protein n=1 Tax=Aspergillus tanneri TaxID=1220188 RepID=A0A4S3JNI7_9EURO|nr:uncharacterized protein ATNIH1004_003267 [Aspergillus tanneri]KAA8650580.1 hypothetical protein ATNIH1004_003267 [Aspergillus tanneri]THC96990.1 hypothetical protein EYZ11_003546 [Aspergillus tanneri]
MPLLAFGSNGSGQLGIGHIEDVSVPTRCLFDEQEQKSSSLGDGDKSPNDVLRITAGGNHTLILFADRTVYATGCNEDGRCGQNTSHRSLLRFRRVIIDDTSTGHSYDTFKDVSATWEGTFLVPFRGADEADAVFVLGSGAKGELGLGPGCVQTTVPKRIPDFPPPGAKIVSISSGMGHTIAVLSSGEVYGWGGARKGQLGDSAAEHKIVWTPLKINNVPFYATGATCGREFTVVTGNQAIGEIAVLGAFGDRWNILSGIPPAGDFLMGYRGVFASWHGIYVHQRDSSVVSWGRNDRGQLPPADLPKSRRIAVGSEHALALLGDRSVVAFGWGEHGNCGPSTDTQGNVKGEYRQIPLPGEGDAAVVEIGAGCATSWIITSR